MSKGFLPGCELANEVWPAGCQSWVRITWRNPAASLLTAGTISSPPGTASGPSWAEFLARAEGVGEDAVRARIEALGPEDVSDVVAWLDSQRPPSQGKAYSSLRKEGGIR